MTFKASILFGLSFMFLISGCSVGPDYKRPDAAVEPNWLDIEDTLVSGDPPSDPNWWATAFHDPHLDKLITMSLEGNLTLRSAGLRVLQSQQQHAIAIGNQYPQFQQISGLASKERSSGNTFEDYNLDFNISWEVDFWGRFRRQVESASALLDASVANYDDAVLSLVSQVAQTYTLIRTFQDRIVVAKDNIDLQAESLRIARAKADAGEVTELDADQAETLLYNTKATVSSLEISLQQLKNSLATLLGKPPFDLNHLLGEKHYIPHAKAEIALGMPQDIIRRRPDVRFAERQLAAQSAQIGFAMTELYPHFSIGGSIGTDKINNVNLFDSKSESWSLFGLFEWNVFNYGRLKSNVRLQDAVFQQLLVDYRNTVLQSQVDAENAIVAYLKSHQQLASYKRAAQASQRSVEISKAQYDNGLVNYNTVINTLTANVAQQDLLSLTKGTVAVNLIEVYKSLGGGWEIRGNRDPVDLLPSETKEQMRQRTKNWKGVLK
jgi:NodT family efflux transporter outer membrane factor (OMF) lipoprotein